MDARRPLRAVAAGSNNENIVFSRQPAHSREKSVGNPKPMAPTGALNAPPKRTAFGDVSNTARARMVDPAGKAGTRETVKARGKTIAASAGPRDARLEDKENRKGGAKENRSKPAASSKGVNHGTKSHENGPRQTANPTSRANANYAHTGTSFAQPPLRNGASKKTTAVYSDRKEGQVNAGAKAVCPVDDLAIPVAKPARSPRQYKSQPSLRIEQHNMGRQEAKLTVRPEKVDDEDEGEIDDDATEAAYEDAVEQMSQGAECAIRDTLAEMEQAHYEGLRQNENHAAEQSKAAPELPGAPELEEYWDEEEEQELYDEQGFTTAHSYRSHGDNTTSGPTTLLAPHVTASVREELEMARAYVAEHQTEEEIEEEAWDVSMVAEYGDEIFAYMRQLEAQMLPNPHYMDDQTEIQWSMRSVLMDWLVQVHHRFCLLPETLFLTVNCIDRFLSVKVVSLGKLQLVGATALFVAAKYEEINCPSVQEIVYMVDSGYSVEEILKAERFMLSMLHFELGWPGPMSFLRRISKADDYDLETRTLAKYFLEITIMDERFVSCPPSYLAAGAHCISRFFLGKGDWTLAHVHYSGYTLSQLKPLIKLLFECCQFPTKHHSAVYEKYATQKYKQSSIFVERKIASGLTLSQLFAGAGHQHSSSIVGDAKSNQYQAHRVLIPTQG
ncbi:hypothetical protein VTH06DRAFT_1311 [Thermothelomyces fergusii]